MINLAKNFVAKFGNDWTMNLAAMLAYNILTTIFPILLALLTLLGFLLSWDHQLLVNLQNGMVNAMPSQLQHTVDIKSALQALSRNSGILLVISLVGLLWSGSNLFGAMENTFDIIFRTKPRQFIQQKLMAFGMIIVFVILAPIMFAASTLINAFGTGAQALIPVHNAVTQLFFQGLSLVVAAALAFVLFLAIYIVVPNLPLSFRHAWRGALAAGILLVIVNLAFPTYVSLTMSGSKNYGNTIYIALIFIAWCWLFAVIVLLGAEINSYAMGMRATDGDLATMIHRERVHKQGQDVPPGHKRPAHTYEGIDRRSAKRDRRGASGAPKAAPPTSVRAIVAVTKPIVHASTLIGTIVGRALGNVGVTILSIVWLVARIRRRPESSA